MMKKVDKISKISIIVLFTLITLLTISIKLIPSQYSLFENQGIIKTIIMYLKNLNIVDLLIGVVIFNFYYDTYYDDNKYNKENLKNSIVSIVISIGVLIGEIYRLKNQISTILGSSVYIIICLIYLIGLYLIFYSLIKKITQVKEKINIKKLKINNKYILKIANQIDDHPVLCSLIFIVICRIPYIILGYPGSITGDTYDSLCQFFHLDGSWSIKMINLKNNNVYINSHHPVLYTLVLGTIVNIGKGISGYNLGMFLFTITQIVISTLIFTFVLVYMKKIKIPLWLRILVLLFIGLTPTIQSYLIIAVKDTPNALFNLVYIIFLIQIIRNYDSIYNKKVNIIGFIIIIFLVLAFRNNGIITVLLSYPLLFLVYKKHWKKLLLVMMIPIILYFSFNQIMFKYFDVSKGSPKELLTVPLMQIARVVKYVDDEKIDNQDKEAIDKVLSYEGLKEAYDSSYPDGIKDRYNKDTTKRDLIELFKVWTKYLVKYPGIYIESFVASTYQYLYPTDSYNYGDIPMDERAYKDFEILNSDKLNNAKKTLHYFNLFISKLPIVGIFFHVGYYVWFLLLSCLYIVCKKKYKYLIPLTPLLSVLLVCFASPLNGSMRYILPIVFSIPACVIVLYLTTIEGNN